MQRTHQPSSRQPRAAAREIIHCGTVVVLLAGMFPGGAHAHTGASSPRPASQGRQRRSTRADTGFDFYDVRIQASENSAPALRKVGSGEEVRVGVYVRYWKPARMKRASLATRGGSGSSQSKNPFFATRARFVCRYTLLYQGLELRHDTVPVDLTLAKGSAVTTFGAFTIALPEGVRENTYLIRAAVTMNGVTQTRTTRFTVYDPLADHR